MVFNIDEEALASATDENYTHHRDLEDSSQDVLAIDEVVLQDYELKIKEIEDESIEKPIEQKLVLPYYVLED